MAFLHKYLKIAPAVQTGLATVFLTCLTLVTLAYTMQRNRQWSSDTVLMPHDALVSPNSARALNGGGSQLILVHDAIKDTGAEARHIKDSVLRTGINMMKKAMLVHPSYVDPLLNLGVAYTRLNKYDSVEYYWRRADSQYKVNFYSDITQRHPYPLKLYKDRYIRVVHNKKEGLGAFMTMIDSVGVPINFMSLNVPGDSAESYKETHPKIKVEFYPLLSDHYMNLANRKGSVEHDYDGCRAAFKKAMQFATGADAELYYNIGGFYYTIGRYDSAKLAWTNCLTINPHHTKAREGINALNNMHVQLIPVKKN
jgi:tetratricopeptide (TPR) repeat protein